MTSGVGITSQITQPYIITLVCKDGCWKYRIVICHLLYELFLKFILIFINSTPDNKELYLARKELWVGSIVNHMSTLATKTKHKSLN